MSRTIRALYIYVLAQNEDIGLEKWLSAIFKIVAFAITFVDQFNVHSQFPELSKIPICERSY